MARRRPLAALIVAALALAGCTTTPVASPTPTPPPSFSCTPEAGGTPYPCAQAEYEEMQKLDQLYAEAEDVYLRSIELRNNALTAGVTEVEPLSRVAGGSALEFLTQDLQAGERLEGGQLTASWVRRLPGYSRSGSVVALEACADSSTGILVFPDGDREPGWIGIERTYYEQNNGQVLMIEIESKLVEAC